LRRIASGRAAGGVGELRLNPDVQKEEGMARNKEVGVIGLGKFGLSLARTLKDLGHTVIGVDSDPQRIKHAQDMLSHVFTADATDVKALEQLGFKDLSQVVVSTGESMEASILVVLGLQELGVAEIWVKAVSERHEKILTRLGVNMVVFPERFVAQQLAHRLSVPGLLEYIELAKGVVVQEVMVGDWDGQTLGELDLRRKHKVQVLAVRKAGATEMDFVPAAHDRLQRGDMMLVMGNLDDVSRLLKGS
jgi:trk system potassium uptake protein TrkA